MAADKLRLWTWSGGRSSKSPIVDRRSFAFLHMLISGVSRIKSGINPAHVFIHQPRTEITVLVLGIGHWPQRRMGDIAAEECVKVVFEEDVS